MFVDFVVALVLFGLPVAAMAAFFMVLTKLSSANRKTIAERMNLMPSWSAAAEKLGLTPKGPHRMEGETLGRPARVKRRDGSLLLELVVPEPLLVVRPLRLNEAHDSTTGDVSFDAVWRTTLPAHAPQVLSRNVRATLLAVADLGPVEVHKGHLRVTVAGGEDPALAARRGFAALGVLSDVIQQNTTTPLGMAMDPLESPTLRVAALRAIKAPSQADAAVLEPLLQDPLEDLRMAAAVTLNDVPTLLAFVGEANAPVELRRRAARVLGSGHDEAVALAFASSSEPELWRDVAVVAMARPTENLSRVLVQVLGPDRLHVEGWRPKGFEDIGYLVRLCRAFEKAPVEGMEPFMAWLLGFDIPIQHQHRILWHLSAHGTVSQVGKLRAIQKGATRDLSKRIEAAILEIQEKTGGHAGAVSVADTKPQEGAVSIVPHTAGRQGTTGH